MEPVKINSQFPIALLALGLSLICASIPFAYRYFTIQTIDPDPFIYGHVATEMLSGKKLYLETWQDKPPLTFVCYAIPQFFGYRSSAAQGLLLGIWLVAQGLLFFAAFRRDLPAAVCCLLFTVLFPMGQAEWVWPSTEHFSNLFISGMLLIAYVIWRDRQFKTWQAVAAGALMVIAFHIRQNDLLAGLIPIAAILTSHQPPAAKRRGMLVLLTGALTCWIVILLLVMRIGNLPGYFYTVFTYPRLYARAGTWSDVARLAVMPASTALPILLMFCATVAATRKFFWFIAGSLVLGIVICLLPRRPYLHYWINLFPFVALYIGMALQRAAIGSARTAWALAAGLTFAGCLMLVARAWSASLVPSYEDYQAVAAAVDSIARPDSTLLVYGPMPAEAIVFTSKVPAANTYCFTFQLLPPYPGILPVPQDQIFLQYGTHPPDIIAIDRKYLSDARGSAAHNAPQNLIRLLLERYSYSTRTAVGNFDILQRG